MKKRINILLILPLLIFLLKGIIFGVDIWYLLNEGKYVLSNGIPYIDPFTIHEGLHFVMQQWLTSVIFYLVYNLLGNFGLILIEILSIIIIEIIIYNLCKLISNKKELSIVFTTIITLLIVSLDYIDIRPQLFTYIFILSFIYIIERYLKYGNWKVLLILPIISILQINMHASMWWFLYVFTLPFICEMLWNTFIKKEKGNYNIKLFAIILSISLLCGLINPYGIDAITYLFNSTSPYINEWVGEMHHPYHFATDYIVMILIMFSNFIVYIRYYKKYNDLKISYLCLLFGCLLLFMLAPKSYIFIYIFGIYPLIYYLKDYVLFIKNVRINIYDVIISKSVIALIVCLIITVCIFNVKIYIQRDEKNIEAVNYLIQNYDTNNIKIYNSYYAGPYLEFNGVKAYIDSRAELFLKSQNKKEDIFVENYDLRKGNISIEELIEKYNFTHLLFTRDPLFNKGNDLNYNKDSIDNYVLDYDQHDVKIWVRKDLINNAKNY